MVSQISYIATVKVFQQTFIKLVKRYCINEANVNMNFNRTLQLQKFSTMNDLHYMVFSVAVNLILMSISICITYCIKNSG